MTRPNLNAFSAVFRQLMLAAAIVGAVALPSEARARSEEGVSSIVRQKPETPQKTLASYAKLVSAPAGVQAACFPKQLKTALTSIQKHFGKSRVHVSSGYRSTRSNRRSGGARRSYHLRCMAADIRIAGVAKHKLARYARTLKGVGGVGTYSCNGIVHVDVGPKRSWHNKCGRR